MTRIEFLRSNDSFQSLSDAQLAVIDSFCTEQEFRQGDRLFKDGETVDYLWLVREGTIDLRVDLPARKTSKEDTILSIRENRILGWSGFFPPYAYKLSGYCASSQCQVVMIERNKFLEYLKENPKVGYPVLSSILQLVGSRFQKLKEAVAKTLPVPSHSTGQDNGSAQEGKAQGNAVVKGEKLAGLDPLEKVDVFNGMTDHQLEAFQQCAELLEFKRGDRIFTEGEDSKHVWIVVDGGIELKSETTGHHVLSGGPAVSFLSESKALGWTCHTPPYKYQFSGYCASRTCKVIKLAKDDLIQIFNSHEEVGYRVMLYLIGVVGKHFSQYQEAIAKQMGSEIMNQW